MFQGCWLPAAPSRPREPTRSLESSVTGWRLPRPVTLLSGAKPILNRDFKHLFGTEINTFYGLTVVRGPPWAWSPVTSKGDEKIRGAVTGRCGLSTWPCH